MIRNGLSEVPRFSILKLFLIPALLIGLSSSVSQAAVPDFQLKDLSEKAWNLHAQKNKATVVVFLSSECPMCNAYLKPLQELADKYQDKGVAFVGINSNPLEPLQQIQAHVKEFNIRFPILRDDKGVSVQALGAKVNPEAFVLDDKFEIRYHGRIDDGYSGRLKATGKTTRYDLKIALDELLAGKPVSLTSALAYGCPLPGAKKKVVAKNTTVSYYKDVLPILQKNCQSCHRPGEVGPFSLENYQQAVKWSEDIIGVVKSKRMPPWKAEPNPFLAHNRQMTEKDVQTLESWVEQGTPEGNVQDAPAKPKFPQGWQLGQPDVILEMPTEAVIGANGRDLFHCVVFPTNFKEDQLISAIEVRPGNPQVVHHTIQILDNRGKARKLQAEAQAKQKETDTDRGPGYSRNMGVGFLPEPGMSLGGWAPGLVPQRLPDGIGQLLPKGADVVMQIHYHRTGKEERDRTKIGLYLTKGKPKEYLQAIPVPGFFLQIPANEKEYRVDTSIHLTEDVTAHWLVPHMHLLGKDIELTVEVPGEKEKSLIKIKEWDYNWQEMYPLKEPLKLPKGTVLRVRATFDNSDSNPLNPNTPPKIVRLGEQTTNEMCFVFVGVSSESKGWRKFGLGSGKR